MLIFEQKSMCYILRAKSSENVSSDIFLKYVEFRVDPTELFSFFISELQFTWFYY